MSERSHEELSALMDGEASELEVRRTIKALDGEPELLQKWRRYHMARSIIQGDLREQGAPEYMRVDIAGAVSDALASEPAHHVPDSDTPTWQARFIKPLSSIAVAASVSAMVVFGWQNFQQTPDSALVQGQGAAEYSIAQNNLPARGTDRYLRNVADSQQQVQRQVITSPDIVRMPSAQNQRLNQYLVSHSGNAALNTASGGMSYTRVVHIAP